jgi:hypothetical protein
MAQYPCYPVFFKDTSAFNRYSRCEFANIAARQRIGVRVIVRGFVFLYLTPNPSLSERGDIPPLEEKASSGSGGSPSLSERGLGGEVKLLKKEGAV